MITNLFNNKEIRNVYNSEKEDYYFSVVDVVGLLINANIPRNYWIDLKRKLKNEVSELYENIVRLKMKIFDGKMRQTDFLDTEGILDRYKMTDVWKENGINESYEHVILTNEIYKSWLEMKVSEYKAYKNISKESLSDNMTDIEVALIDLGEIATRKLAKKYGLKENKEVARHGGKIAKNIRDDLEQELGETIISNSNSLSY